MRSQSIALAALLLLAGCGLTMPSFDFLKFGGGSKKEAVVIDPTRLMPDMSEARLEPIQEGAILRVTGIAPTQGYHSAFLLPVEGTPAILRYQVRALPPEFPARQGSVRSRQLLMATILTSTELQGVRTIEVISGNRTIRLRNR